LLDTHQKVYKPLQSEYIDPISKGQTTMTNTNDRMNLDIEALLGAPIQEQKPVSIDTLPATAQAALAALKGMGEVKKEPIRIINAEPKAAAPVQEQKPAIRVINTEPKAAAPIQEPKAAAPIQEPKAVNYKPNTSTTRNQFEASYDTAPTDVAPIIAGLGAVTIALGLVTIGVMHANYAPSLEDQLPTVSQQAKYSGKSCTFKNEFEPCGTTWNGRGAEVKWYSDGQKSWYEFNKDGSVKMTSITNGTRSVGYGTYTVDVDRNHTVMTSQRGNNIQIGGVPAFRF
jgi:hypothetical protein